MDAPDPTTPPQDQPVDLPVTEPLPAGPATAEPAPSPHNLRRSTTDRYLGGVSGGIGESFGIDPIIPRIAFVALFILGGAGFVVYVLAWLFVPTTEGKRVLGRNSVGRIAAASGLLILAGAGGIGAGWAALTGSGLAVAWAIVALGTVLVVAAFQRQAAWLFLVALALAAPLGIAAAADVRIEGAWGDTRFRPTTDGQIRPVYEHGVGAMVVDVRGLEWATNQRRTITIDQGIGEARVLVPEGVCVAYDVHIGAGAVDEQGGGDLDVTDPVPSAGKVLIVRGDMGFGAFVSRSDDRRDDIGDRRFDDAAFQARC